ncbi:MAG: ABC transporter ATP-binding protein [Tissierellia bacterium]|nr:ABC transporter ATP-binding protein [Tissierellia bacterium]
MYLVLKKVNKSYGDGANYQSVLKDVNLEIEKGEMAIILGPSGSGKSTLLNIIGGLDFVDSGEVYLEDLCVTDLNKDKIIDYRRDHIGFVFQFYNLVPNLTVYENIEVCKFLTKNPLDIDELLENLDLIPHKNKYPSQLSGGQQQRCSLARALVKNPDLLLCDEPTGALDSKSSLNMLELLEKINKIYDTTMLIVTHNEAIKSICNRIIEIKDGMIVNNSINDEMISAKELVL